MKSKSNAALAITLLSALNGGIGIKPYPVREEKNKYGLSEVEIEAMRLMDKAEKKAFLKRVEFRNQFKTHSSLCRTCAEAKGGKLPTGAQITVSSGVCGFCNREDTLIPWTDFNWPMIRSTWD